MDYKNNQRFFDKEFNKKTSVIFTVGAIAAGIGGLIVVLGLLGIMRYYISYSIGWPILIFGVIVLLVAFSRMVKESEITGVGDGLIAELKEKVNESLEYPDDLELRSIVFVGCAVTDENLDKARKLKSGNYVSPELTISFFYEKKDGIYIAERIVSFLKEGHTDKETFFKYGDFDLVRVDNETLKNEAKVSFVRFYKDNKIIYEAPLMDNDYYKEEYFNTVMHNKEKFDKAAKS